MTANLRTALTLLLLLFTSHRLEAQVGAGANVGLTDLRPTFGTPTTVSPVSGPAGLTQEQVQKMIDQRLLAAQSTTISGKEPFLKTVWRNGFVAESEDKAFRLHIGGLLHVDTGWWQAQDQVINGPGGVGPLVDGAMFRRARLHIHGAMYENVEWRMEVGFERGSPCFASVGTGLSCVRG